MTEVLSRGVEYDPMLDYGAENIPPVDVQSEFFKYALLEGAEIRSRSRLLRGPLYGEFYKILAETDEQIKKVNPNFTAEHIVPTSYQAKKARTEVLKLSPKDRLRLTDIKNAKTSALRAVAAYHEATEESAEQRVDKGCLGVPPYVSQVDDWDHAENVRGCANACFRMVFGAITDWTPSQEALSTQLIEHHGTSVVDDYVYSNLYQTEIFGEICKKEVTTLEVLGTDLSVIGKVTKALRARRSDAEVYCTLNLSSEMAGDAVWHTVILLEANEERVVYHDPSTSSGGAYKTMTREKFTNRWAVSYNRAVLTIAT